MDDVDSLESQLEKLYVLSIDLSKVTYSYVHYSDKAFLGQVDEQLENLRLVCLRLYKQYLIGTDHTPISLSSSSLEDSKNFKHTHKRVLTASINDISYSVISFINSKEDLKIKTLENLLTKIHETQNIFSTKYIKDLLNVEVLKRKAKALIDSGVDPKTKYEINFSICKVVELNGPVELDENDDCISEFGINKYDCFTLEEVLQW